LDNAELIGTLIETLFYGIALCLGLRTISVFREQKRLGRLTVASIFSIAPYIMLTTATLHLAIDWYRSIYAFPNLPNKGARNLFLSSVKEWNYPVKDTLLGIQTWTADSILVYRCYLVWQKSPWVPLIPALCFIASFVSGWGVIITEGLKKDPNVFSGNLHRYIMIFFICTVSTTVTSTSLILLKIWLTRRQVTGSRGNLLLLSPSLTAFLESGAAYCTVVLLLFGFFFTGSAVQEVMLNTLSSLIPLLFSNILLKMAGVRGDSAIPEASVPSNGVFTSRNRTWGNIQSQITSVPARHEDLKVGVHITRHNQIDGNSIDESYKMRDLEARG